MAATPPGEQSPRDELVDRLRDVLAGRTVREVAMFGGRAFMVDDRLAVSAGRDGDLLVHVDPYRHAGLLALPGARDSFMGDRPMGPGWLTVDRAQLDTAEQLRFWVELSLEHPAA